ncbi:MAG: hypothetical protein ACE5FS_01640 [Paracoccaceae bacterium]
MQPAREPEGADARRVVMIANGTADQTAGRLLARLAAGVRRSGHIFLHFRDLPAGRWAKMRYLLTPDRRLIGGLARCDTVVVHTAAMLSLPAMLTARALRKRVVVFFWDDYTARAGGAGRVAGTLERFALKLAHAVAVPSGDYLRAPPVRKAAAVSVVPLWPSHENMPPHATLPRQGARMRIVFAGQINALRDIPGAVAELAPRLPEASELHVFSAGRPDIGAGLPRNFRIIGHRRVAQDSLPRRLSAFDFGLVSLDRGFRGPAFPSKILTYLAAGLPVIYRGPQLDAVVELLERRQLGVVLRAGETSDLTSRLTALAAGFASARAAHFRRSGPDWNAIADLF